MSHTNIIRLVFCLCAAALLVGALLPGKTSAQQFLGKARQACTGTVTVTTPERPVLIQPFQALRVNVGSPNVIISCNDQQPVTLKCPDKTNQVLIDRTQGANIYSIICLRN
jgi:hypothetical protein